MGDSVIELTAEFKQVELKISEYKTLGLKVKYEDLGTVTAGKMVENFNDALKLMWDQANNNDEGMQKGTALETNKFYTTEEYANAEAYLATEFGYHVLVANKFTGRATGKDADKVVTTIKVPTLVQVELYEKADDDAEIMPVEIASVEAYFKPIKEDFASSYWYQINVMKQLIAEISADNSKLTFTDANKKAQLIRIAQYYIDNYYLSLTYVCEGYDYTVDLMDIFTDAYNGYANGNDNIDVATLNKLAALADAQIAKINVNELNATETKEFNELKEAFDKAKAELKK